MTSIIIKKLPVMDVQNYNLKNGQILKKSKSIRYHWKPTLNVMQDVHIVVICFMGDSILTMI